MASVVAARDEKEKERRDASVGLRARPRASSVLPRPPRPSRALKSSFFKIKSRLWLAGKQDVGISRQISQLAPLCGPVRIYKPSQQMENGWGRTSARCGWGRATGCCFAFSAVWQLFRRALLFTGDLP